MHRKADIYRLTYISRADIYMGIQTLPIYLTEIHKKNPNVDNQKPYCKGGFIGTFPSHRDVY